MYNIPLIDDIIDHAKKSLYLQQDRAQLTFENVVNMEIKLSVALHWNLYQNNITDVFVHNIQENENNSFDVKSNYSKLSNTDDVQKELKASLIVSDEILINGVYWIPI